MFLPLTFSSDLLLFLSPVLYRYIKEKGTNDNFKQENVGWIAMLIGQDVRFALHSN